MDYIKALGTSGALSVGKGTTCLQLSEDTLIDAGNVINALGDKAARINHIFLTHSHFDHIADIAAMLDLFFETRTTPLHLYGLPETLSALKDSIFNNRIFPDFYAIDLTNKRGKSIQYHPLNLYEKYTAGSLTLMPFPTEHTVPSCGYVIQNGPHSIAFTSDTGIQPEIYAMIDRDPSITTLITEVSFPSSYHERAVQSKHLTPTMLSQELKRLTRDDVRILVMHLKPDRASIIEEELHALLGNRVTILHDGDTIPYTQKPIRSGTQSIYTRYNTLLETGIALTSGQSQIRLSEVILRSARELTHSDAGTLYLLSDDEQRLHFQTIQNDSLDIRTHTSLNVPDWEPIPLYHDDGSENHALAAAHCALTRELIRIDDIYGSSESFNFNQTIKYDQLSGYRSHSMLLIPLLDYQHNLIGVLQLINKLDANEQVTTFSKDDEQVISALGSQAVISITNQKLINDLELLFESFLRSINLTMEKKSAHMKGHVQRVTELSMMIARSVHDNQTTFSEKSYNETEMKIMEIAAMMHDIGKITTPAHIIDKGKKLEKIYDRIDTIKLKLDLFKMLNPETKVTSNVTLNNRQIDEAYRFLVEANHGREYFDEEKRARLKEMARWSITIDGDAVPLLTSDELDNLSIQKGTLTSSERDIINHHATVSIEFLNEIQFPKRYSRVPEIAGSHHEKPNGKGYPKGLKGDEISFEARILAIADIFEALTASDRPYKRPNTLSEAMRILHAMAQEGDIDDTICKLFYDNGIYLEYAKRFMKKELIDAVEIEWD